jgi:hypothetical protein
MSIFLDLLLGRCPHGNYSFPQTVRTRRGKQTTVSCFDCARRLNYDWESMRIIPWPKEAPVAAVLPSQKKLTEA